MANRTDPPGSKGNSIGTSIGNDIYDNGMLPEVTITPRSSRIPELTEAAKKELSLEKYIQSYLPPWASKVGISADNMNPRDRKRYQNLINDKVAEGILVDNKKPGRSQKDRLKWFNSLTEDERDIVNNSSYANKFAPAMRAETVRDAQEAKKNVGFWESLSDPQKFASALKGTGEQFRLFPNAENNYEDFSPLKGFGDAVTSLGTIPKNLQDKDYQGAAFNAFNAALGIGAPMVGAKGAGQFVNNMVNPLAGTGDIISNGINKLGNKSTFKSEIDWSNWNKQALDDRLGDYNRVLQKGSDVHDVRKKYHNSLLLDSDEIDLLKKQGEGKRVNYRNKEGGDALGEWLKKDTSIPETPQSRRELEELIFGKNYPKIEPKSTLETNIKYDTPFLDKETQLNIKSNVNEINNFIESLKTNSEPFSRTKVSREADKWLDDWFRNDATKQKFINYGGTEKEWNKILDTLDNPIRSSVKYGKNRPIGVYHDTKKQASISLDAKIDAGIHEGVHKTRLLLSDKDPILYKLWNDLTDSIREIPTESYPEIFRMRYKLGLKPNEIIDMNTLEKGINMMSDGYMIGMKVKDKNKLLEVVNRMPAIVPFIGAGTYMQNKEYKNGGAIGNNGMFDMSNPNIYKTLVPTATGINQLYNNDTPRIEKFAAGGFVKNTPMQKLIKKQLEKEKKNSK